MVCCFFLIKSMGWDFCGFALQFSKLLIIKHYSIFPQKTITVFVDCVSKTRHRTSALPNRSLKAHLNDTLRQPLASAVSLFEDSEH